MAADTTTGGPGPLRVGAAPPDRYRVDVRRHRATPAFAAGLARRWQAVPQPVWDVALTALLMFFAILSTYALLTAPDAPGLGGWPMPALAALGAVAALPVLGRRHWPVGALLLHAGAVAAYHLAGLPTVVTPATTVLLLYAAAVRGHVLIPLLTGVPTSLVVQIWPGSPVAVDRVPDAVLTTAVAVGTGVLIRQRRAQAVSADERAARAERERDLRAAAAVSAERTRIARELHDVVAHNLGFVVLEATAGRHASTADPQVAREALERIEHTGREGLREMRLLLGLLRDSGDRPGLEEPQPGLDQLPALTERARAAGLRVDLTVTGDAALPAAVDLSAYRIVQEALTNVAKHAAATHVEVEVGRRVTGVRLRIADDGRGAVAAHPDRVGHGLIGMRERAALFGGRVQVGPGPTGGFEVQAWLPVTEENQ